MKLSFRLPSLSARGGTAPGVGGRLRALRRKLKPIAIWGLTSLLLVLAFMWLSLPTRALARPAELTPPRLGWAGTHSHR